jgi:hypothetical protein
MDSENRSGSVNKVNKTIDFGIFASIRFKTISHWRKEDGKP